VLAARRGGVVSGIDIASNLIAKLANALPRKVQIDFEEADAEALPFHSAQFDLVVTCSASCSRRGPMSSPPSCTACQARWANRASQLDSEDSSGKCSRFSRPRRRPRGRSFPMGWGEEATVNSRLRHGFTDLRLTRRIALMRYPFPPADGRVLSPYYGTRGPSLRSTPPLKTLRDLVELQSSSNISTDPGTTEVAASIWKSTRHESERRSTTYA
jgi:hypothetical protein